MSKPPDTHKLDSPCIGDALMKARGHNLREPPADRLCGAKTRDGDPCKNWGIRPSGRCRMHGGKSPQGFASRTFKHGRYSRHLLTRLLWVYSDEGQEVARRAAAKRAARIEAIIAQERAERAAKEAARPPAPEWDMEFIMSLRLFEDPEP